MTAHEVPGRRRYEFGLRDRLRAAREQAGFTTRTFAERTGISKNSISNYETGKTTPRRPQIMAWAMATEFDFDWLESGATPESDGPDGGIAARHARTDV